MYIFLFYTTTGVDFLHGNIDNKDNIDVVWVMCIIPFLYDNGC